MGKESATYIHIAATKKLAKKYTGKDDQGGMLESLIVNGHPIWVLKINACPCFSEPIFATKPST